MNWRCCLVFLLISCADPEEGNPGVCSITCTDAKIADPSFNVVPLNPESTGICTNLGRFPGPLRFLYAVSRETIPKPTGAPRTSGEAGGDGEETGEGDAGGGGAETASTDYTSPVAGVTFEPIVYSGSMYLGGTSEENADLEKEGDSVEAVSPFRYAGIVTPKSEWCTDTCGVASVEIWPNCISSAQTIAAAIKVGPKISAPVLYNYESESTGE